MVTVIGHRGAGTLEPENTIRGFERAEREGADELELDLRLTKDGRLVVLHDATVDRTTDGSGPVAELTWDEVRHLDAGSGESIPLFDDVVDQTSLPFQAEVKSADAIEVFADTVRARRLANRLYATSQSAEILQAIRDAVPDVRSGLIVASPSADIVQKCSAAGATIVCPKLSALTAEMVASLHAAGIRVLPWPVNTAAAHATIVAQRVDGFATDRLDLARRWESGRP